MRPLSDRQRDALNCIRISLRERGMPPSRSELAKAMGLASPSAADFHLHALARKGWIELVPSQDRGIRLLADSVPVVPLGTVPAGAPRVPEEGVLTRLPAVVAEQFRPTPDFFLKVEGESMNRLGLTAGSLAAIRLNPDPVDGDVVVARIDGEATLKRFFRTGPHSVELRPESTHEEHRPIEVDLRREDFAVVGVYVGALIGSTES